MGGIPEKIEYKIEKYEKTILVADYVKECVDAAYFQGLCKSCPNYQKTWSCPEFDFDTLDYWNKYKYMKILGTKIVLPPELQDKSYTEKEIEKMREQTLWAVKKQLTEEMFELEKQVPGSVHLSAGYCLICGAGNCAKAEGKPCRFPEKLRYSIESLGGNVTKTAAYIGQELEWTAPDKMPHHYLLVCALLYN